MPDIDAKEKTVRELLDRVKYSIDYYQREFKWNEKHVTELVNDLVIKFYGEYKKGHERREVANYSHYFLGSIITTEKNGTKYLIDGQQRLTALTLFLIFLDKLQKERSDSVDVKNLIFSKQFDRKSFNLDIEERTQYMEALFEDRSFDISDASESIKNLSRRYGDIEIAFPNDLRTEALPYFIDWLIERVYLVDIKAFTDNDAYSIFESMNDRGLRLTPTEMLKGYLLANIDEDHREQANSEWKENIQTLNNWGKEVDADFFKAWFRSQYSTKIRERKRGSTQQDFDRIGTEFHRWVKDARKQINLISKSDFLNFIQNDLRFYTKQYCRLIEASRNIVPGLEHVRYNSLYGFTLQYIVLLAPLRTNDSDDVICKKIRIAAQFIEILLTWRIWNFRSIAYSTMQYAMFLVMRDIRGLELNELARTLHGKLINEQENFDRNSHYHEQEIGFYLHQQNRKFIHQILARITDFIEVQSNMESHFEEYMESENSPYEVEHIWADKFDQHQDEFQHPADFTKHRNRIGGLLLLPKTFNGSYGKLPYKEKLPHYYSQNLLAKSLNPQCYAHNPGFIRFRSISNLPFEPIECFTRESINKRTELYRQIAKTVWNPENLFE